jgi:hypothetical protein
MADINETLRKVKALADGTANEHERESALKKFYELMEKHGITEDCLEDESVTTHDFKWNGKREHSLLVQIIVKVFDDSRITTYNYRRNGRKVGNTLGLDCTTAQKLEIDFMFDFYKILYRREEETFFDAFIQKHKLFGPPSGKGKKLSDEDYMKMIQLMRGMEDASPQKRLAVDEEATA